MWAGGLLAGSPVLARAGIAPQLFGPNWRWRSLRTTRNQAMEQLDFGDAIAPVDLAMGGLGEALAPLA